PATASVEVSVVGLPDVTASADNDAICLGQPVTLTGGGASEYEWSPASITNGTPFVPETAGSYTYTVIGKDSFGCTNEATITITVAEPMSLTFENTLPTDGTDGEIDLTVHDGVAPFTFDWDNDGLGDMDDDEDLIGVGPGAYTVIVTGASGCTEEMIIFLDSQLSIDDLNENIAIYPNPTTENVTIEMEGQFNYTLQTIQGATLLTGVGNQIETISLENYESGTYLISIQVENQLSTLKIIKQ
ncbi:T9SS type A sorting domain-containing protein, partial [Crocinitomix algicola]|uniref:T9SS type A sorting domain-containing protein n=1 Tax=Crocinitomix algicola TaxID=1740263 RepID=UPI001112F247